MATTKKVVGITVGVISAVIVAALAIFLYFHFWFVYADGTDTGELNYFSRKGVVFKTYEGKIIQAGFKQNTTGAQSNEFRFSVENEAVADSLMHCTGKQVEVHYNQYRHTLWWRGESVFVVDSIWSVK